MQRTVLGGSCQGCHVGVGCQAHFCAVHCGSDQLTSCPQPQPSLLALPDTVPQELLSLWFHPPQIPLTQTFKARPHPPPQSRCLDGVSLCRAGPPSPEPKPRRLVPLSTLSSAACWQAAAAHHHQPSQHLWPGSLSHSQWLLSCWPVCSFPL